MLDKGFLEDNRIRKVLSMSVQTMNSRRPKRPNQRKTVRKPPIHHHFPIIVKWISVKWITDILIIGNVIISIIIKINL
jgi:hypothetical protein